MVLTNGDKWTVSPSNKGTRSNVNSEDNWMYGDDSTTLPTTLNYYINGVLKYTSTITSATVYPQIQSVIKDSEISINADWVTTNSITFTIDDYNTQPAYGQKIALGLDASQSKEDWDRLDFSFSSYADGVAPETVYVRVQESGSVKWSSTMTPVNGDTFKISWSTVTTSATKLPPPPAMVRL